MKRLLLILLFFPMLMSAQLNADKTTVDLGLIEEFNNDTAYFNFTNTGSKVIYLLPTQPSDEYLVLCNSTSVQPGETLQIGIVYFTDKKGRFTLSVPLSFSHKTDATVIQVKGNIKSIKETAFTTCPTIENSKPLQPSQVPLSIVVRDANTLEFLYADVKVLKARNTYGCVSGLNSKTYKCNCGYGPLLVDVSKKGYQSERVDFLYDPDNFKVIVDLKPMPKDTIEEHVIPEEEPLPYQPPIVDNSDTVVKEVFYNTEPLVDSGFNSYKFKPNHLIFIIDISGSMKDSSKLYLLKKAMMRLVMSVRPQDHITLITYAYKVKVVFENYSGMDRSAMLKAIDTLTANGGSNGAQSLVMAYDIARSHFIKDGNNQIFLATDGLFNSNKLDNEDLYRVVRKGYNQDGIILSSIGFGKDEKALEFMQRLARHGHGNFLRINNADDDIEVLLNEVKLQSTSKK